MRTLLARYLPLVGHVVPTLAIGYGLMIPRSCIAGWNVLTVGFGASVLGTCVAYALGLHLAATRDANGARGHAPS